LKGSMLSSLTGLAKLHSISLIGTGVDFKSVRELGKLPALQEVYLWNTSIGPQEAAQLQKEFPGIRWDLGDRSEEILKLTPPILVNESLLLDKEGVQLKNNLPGVQIRYTLDGTEPDSTTGTFYKGPVVLSAYTVMKAKSFKDGWYGSPSVQFYFFKKGVHPTEAELLTSPHKEYKGEGVAGLIDDKKGSADEFRNSAWMAFREIPMEALFNLGSATTETITLSFAEGAGAYILPPASVEVWGGADKAHLKLLQKVIPEQPKGYGPTVVKGIVMKVEPANYYKIIARPVPKVPTWISKKPDKGWLFVDEVIFN